MEVALATWATRLVVLSKVGTAVAAIVLACGLAQGELSIGHWGLIHSLTPVFFIGLAVLTMSAALLWIAPVDHPRLVFIQSILLITALNFTPIALEGLGWSREGFQGGIFEYVVRNGQLDPGVAPLHAWPGMSLVLAAFTLISGANELEQQQIILRLAPTLINLWYLVPLFLIFRILLGQKSNRWGAAVWIFYLANRTSQDYLSAQAVAYFFFLSFVWFSVKRALKQDEPRGLAQSGIEMVIAGALTITHLATTLVTLVFKAATDALRRPRRYTFVAYGAVVAAAWIIYGTATFFEDNLASYVRTAFSLDYFRGTTTTRITETPDIYAHIDQVATFYMAAFLLLALLGVALSWRTVKQLSPARMTLVLWLSPFLVFLLVPYGGERLMRVFLFSLVPMAYFAATLLRHRFMGTLLVIFLILAPALYFVTKYGYEAYEYVHPSEGAGLEYLYENVGARPSVMVGDVRFLSHKYQEYYKVIDYEILTTAAGGLTPNGRDLLDFQHDFVVASRADRERWDLTSDAQQRLDDAYEIVENSRRYQLIYDSGGFKLYGTVTV
jgi:hypothetical protein